MSRRRPFPARDSPHIRPMAKTPARRRSQRSRTSHPRQGGAARGAGHARRARRTAQSGHRARHRGAGLRHRAPPPSAIGPARAQSPNRNPPPRSESGIQPPPATSWERRQDFSAAHTARKSAKGADKTSRIRGSAARRLRAALARSPGSIRRWRRNSDSANDGRPSLSPLAGEGGDPRHGGSRVRGSRKAESPPHPPTCGRRPLPARRGEVKEGKTRNTACPAPICPAGHGLSSMGVAATASRSNDCCARAGRNSAK